MKNSNETGVKSHERLDSDIRLALTFPRVMRRRRCHSKLRKFGAPSRKMTNGECARLERACHMAPCPFCYSTRARSRYRS